MWLNKTSGRQRDFISAFWRRRGLFTEPELHGLDLRLLVHDDLLRESPHARCYHDHKSRSRRV
jgi:hypothetical protein